MKKIILPLIIFMTTSSAFAEDRGFLDGTSFCRTAMNEEAVEHKDQRKDCIHFSEGVATDNGPALFGNSPLVYEYRANQLGKNAIFIVSFGNSVYQLSADGKSLMTIKGSRAQGVLLNMK